MYVRAGFSLGDEREKKADRSERQVTEVKKRRKKKDPWVFVMKRWPVCIFMDGFQGTYAV